MPVITPLFGASPTITQHFSHISELDRFSIGLYCQLFYHWSPSHSHISIQHLPVHKLTTNWFHLSAVLYTGLLLTSSQLPDSFHLLTFLLSIQKDILYGSENHTDYFKEHSLCTHWTQVQPSTSPHRARVVCSLSLAFLSRPVEIGLMKHATLSEICLNTDCGIHLQLVPAEADHRCLAHTFLSSVPPPCSTACLLLLRPPSSTTNLHLLSMWNSPAPPHPRLFFAHACALSVK